MTQSPEPHFIVRSQHPFNAETPLPRLRGSFLTPQSDFYIRSHGDVPRIDPAAYRLKVGGAVPQPLELSLDDLASRFPRHTVVAVMQCAGNRRGDLQGVRRTSGDPWDAGAIGNASWTGVRLADVLRAAGLEDPGGLHVEFLSHDDCEQDGERFRYGVSVAATKAMSDEALLATEMNGEALTPAHGFPLRAVIPGYAGARSAKWLDVVTVLDRPSENPMQARDYKLFPPDIRKETADWEHGLTIDEMPLNSAICEPARGARVRAGRLPVRGYAVVSGRAVARVDVSADGGRTWTEAQLEDERSAAPWAWAFWSAELDLPPGSHELVVRAVDTAGQVQPARPEDVWNFKGYLSAAWHRVGITAV